MLGTSGKYRLDTRLGGGGMAEVFLGSMLGAEGFSRRVAIKRVLPGFSDNPAFAQMFVAEAQISSQLQHPNIVSVLDFDRDPDGRLFLVMELVDGRDLDALAASGPLPFPVIIYVISDVLRGLGHAHDLPFGNNMRGLVHRDVSPHNVLLSWEGAVKVSDFGIAKARQASEATASVFIKGKPAYMSPEQANGQSLDGRSDLFAVGVMLWEMLTGRRLFVGEDTRATLAAVLFGQIPRPRAVRPDVPKDLEKVAMKLLERDLPARYATAEQAINDLLECDDAPKNGREQLIRVLAERFPHNAPVRDSIARSRSGGTPPHMQSQQPYQALGPAQQTIAGGSGSHTPSGATVPPAASIGGYRATPTGTMQPMATVPPRKSGARLAVILVSILVAGMVTFGIILATRKTENPGSVEPPPGGSGTAIATTAGSDSAVPDTAPVAVVNDAALPDAEVVAVAPADAGTETPKKDANVTKPGEKRVGRLVVKAFPVVTVYVDNKKVHDTPVDMNLPVGKHKLRLVNAEVGKDETVSVTIEANKTATIERN
ncbi:MAG TPA: serine/threonine-protein kinase [Kofleriaceae bacterium]|nr:serine/threonine-protein kinase [Kofleriaceae bacterium]